MGPDIHVARVTPRDEVRLRPYLSNDFLTTSSILTPFLDTAVASGTINQPNAGVVTKDHPGWVRIASSTSANSGYFIGTNVAQILLGGGELFECIWRPAALANNTTRLGFHDTSTSSDATDGVYLEIDGSGIVTGKTANNSTRSSTGTTGSVSANTNYRATIQLNADATLATFTLYSDAGAVLWTDTLGTNIPTASGRETGASFIITNSLTSAIDLCHVDFMAVAWGRRLVRGA